MDFVIKNGVLVKCTGMEKEMVIPEGVNAPHTIQTDNGSEFCNSQKTDRVHIFDFFCMAAKRTLLKSASAPTWASISFTQASVAGAG